MKKIIYAALFSAVVLSFVSCGSKDAGESNMSDKARVNMDAFQAINNAFLTGDTSKINEIVASDFVDHSMKGNTDRDSLKAMITSMHISTKDLKMESKKDFADDDYVMSWAQFSGENLSDPEMPKGKFDFNALEVVKFKDGKAVEHWEFMQPGDMMKMMQQSHMETPKDSTKKM